MNDLSRRRFLAVTSTAAAGAVLFDPSALLRAADDPYAGWPVGVQSYSLRNFNTRDAIRHIHGMGVHYVEFFSKHLAIDASPHQIEETQKLLADAGISLRAHGVNGFSKDHDKNRATFEFAKRAGIRNITADPLPDSFDSLDKLVEEFDVRICIHNHGPTHRYNKIEDVKNAVKDHHKLIGACVDTGHFIRSGIDPVQAITELADRVFAVHIKDDKFKGDKRSHNVIIGQANLDVAGIFKALKQVNFPADGSLSLEYEANPDNPIDDMKQCLAVAQEAIAKVNQAG
jgi:sugar phosphate isomerase/epimerase